MTISFLLAVVSGMTLRLIYEMSVPERMQGSFWENVLFPLGFCATLLAGLIIWSSYKWKQIALCLGEENQDLRDLLREQGMRSQRPMILPQQDPVININQGDFRNLKDGTVIKGGVAYEPDNLGFDTDPPVDRPGDDGKRVEVQEIAQIGFRQPASRYSRRGSFSPSSEYLAWVARIGKK